MRWIASSLVVVGLLLPFGCADDGLTEASSTSSEGTADTTATGATTTSSTTTSSTTTEGSSGPTGEDTVATTADGTASSDGGTDTGGGPGTSCVQMNDCVIVDDCCTCGAVHVDDTPRPCEMRSCDQTMCEAHGIMPMLECDFGACQLAETSCNQAEVLCDAPPPACPDGWLPEVQMGCWAGDCVPAEACDIVPDCTWCGANEACLEIVAGAGVWSTCAPVPPECNGTPTCECLGEACPMPFDTCAEGDEGLTCSCPNCAGQGG